MKTALALLATILALAVAVMPAAAAEKPNAKVVPFPETGTYNGQTYAADDLLKRSLACNVKDRAFACFDTEQEARLAGDALEPVSGGVTALASCSPPLILWAGVFFSGGSIAFYDRLVWQNMPGGWANVPSSANTGCTSARIADLPGGGGASALLTANAAFSGLGGMDNRTESIYRY